MATQLHMYLKQRVIVKTIFKIRDNFCNSLHWHINDNPTSKSVKNDNNKMIENIISYILTVFQLVYCDKEYGK